MSVSARVKSPEAVRTTQRRLRVRLLKRGSEPPADKAAVDISHVRVIEAKGSDA